MVVAAVAALALLARAVPAMAEPARLVTPPPGWREDPEQAGAIAQRLAATTQFGGLPAEIAAEAYVAEAPGNAASGGNAAPGNAASSGNAPSGHGAPAQPGQSTMSPAGEASLNDGRVRLPPMTIPQDARSNDRRTAYLGAGVVVLAVMFWWNRRRRDRFEREDRGAPARVAARDDDADDLHAAARSDTPAGADRPDRRDRPARPGRPHRKDRPDRRDP